MKIGYKVVQAKNGKFVSTSDTFDNPYSLEYTIGTLVKPKEGGGPIFLFFSLEDAMTYAWDTSNGRILEVLYEPSETKLSHVLQLSVEGAEKIGDFWKTYYKDIYNQWKVPLGTAFAKCVYVLKEVEKE